MIRDSTEKSTNQTNNPESKAFHFPSTLLATYSQTKLSRRAVSASVHLLSMGLTSHLFAVSAKVNGHTMDRIT